MAGAFVLGALEPADEAAVRAHLATCRRAHDEIAELGGVLPVLAESVPIVEPPAGLKARIMAAAAEDLAARSAGAPPAQASAGDRGRRGVRAGGHDARRRAGGRDRRLPDPTSGTRARAAGLDRAWILRIAAVFAIVALGG